MTASNADSYLLELKKIQDTELDILLRFDKICRENNLTYCLDGGTALGAVRHKGFIPWDDDIDVNMPRNDYDTFMEIGQEQLGEEFFLQNRNTDPSSPFSFAKIRKNNTTFLEWNKRNIKMHHGIFIDIFPLDVLPRNLDYREKYIEKCYRLNNKLVKRMIPDRSSVPKKSIKWIVGAISRRIQHYLLCLIPAKSIDREINEEFPKYNSRGFDGNDCISHSYATKTVLPSEIMFPPKEIDFEGHKFYAPADCDAYLKILYGNYMQLPKEEDRIGHRPQVISFDKEIFEGK